MEFKGLMKHAESEIFYLSLLRLRFISEEASQMYMGYCFYTMLPVTHNGDKHGL